MLSRIFYAALLVLVTGSAVAAGPDACKTDKLLNDVRNVISSIRSYDIKIASQYGNAKSVSFASGVTPDKFYLKQVLESPSSKMTTTTVYDGVYQWVDMVGGDTRKLYKIKLEKIVKPGRPFDTSFNIYGTGLLSGEDYPGTLNSLLSFYKLEADCSNGNIKLSGLLDKKLFSDYAKLKGKSNPEYINKYAELFSFITFSVDDKYRVKSYEMGPSISNMTLSTSFDIKSINKKIDKNIFTITIPKGLVVADITDDLLPR